MLNIIKYIVFHILNIIEFSIWILEYIYRLCTIVYICILVLTAYSPSPLHVTISNIYFLRTSKIMTVEIWQLVLVWIYRN